MVAKEKKRGVAESFLPDFCRVRMVFVVVVSAELLAIVLTLDTSNSLQQFAAALSLRSLFVQWVALTGCALLCLLRTHLGRYGNRTAGIAAWLILMLLTLLVSLFAIKVLAITSAGQFLLKSLGISAIVSALMLRYLYFQYLWRLQVQAESQARFQALQSRIRPHFLFNSMNTIASLTRSDPRLAEGVVHDLSDLFRASLSDVRDQNTLGDELELARGYLRIEHQRLGGRLHVEWDLEELPERAVLPALILQPLLENAVYHGIEPAAEPGVIQISGRYRRRQVNLSIRNSQPPGDAVKHRKGNRMALENTRQRLLGFFDGEATLSEAAVDGDHQVRVVFPYPYQPK
ncbi:MAG: histidine kinase [Sedimenticola sp.]